MEENIRDLENQKHELERKIRQYYEKEEKENIQRNEEEYVGKCYKFKDGDSTFYYKILSGLTNNSKCYMHRMIFRLPIDLEFKNVSRINYSSKYEYGFYGDVVDFDERPIKPLPIFRKQYNAHVEITTEEFEDALKELGKQLLKASRDDYTMNGKYFNEY